MEIRNELDAWRYVEHYLQTGTADRVVLVGWPTMAIAVKGEDYYSTIHVGQMEAYLEFQAAVNRAYAAVARGHFDSRYLKDYEEEELELQTEVKEGSSIFHTDLSPIVHAIAGVITKASPAEVIVAGVLICLTITAPAILKRIYSGRARELELKNNRAVINELIRTNATEKRQIALHRRAFSRVAKRFPAMKGLMPQLGRAQKRLLISLQDADGAKINGVSLSREQIEELGQRRARVARERTYMDEEFEVRSMTKRGDRYTLLLRNDTAAVLARLNTKNFGDNKMARLIRAFHKSALVEFKLEIRRYDQSTLKGIVLDFTVPKA